MKIDSQGEAPNAISGAVQCRSSNQLVVTVLPLLLFAALIMATGQRSSPTQTPLSAVVALRRLHASRGAISSSNGYYRAESLPAAAVVTM